MGQNNNSEIILNGWQCTFTEDREWIYKAIPFSPLKKKSEEKPQIKVIEKIEAEYEKAFEEMLQSSVKDIARYLV